MLLKIVAFETQFIIPSILDAAPSQPFRIVLICVSLTLILRCNTVTFFAFFNIWFRLSLQKSKATFPSSEVCLTL